MARRKSLNVFGLTFLDAMTCGLGAVILLYMIINGSVEQRKKTLSKDLQAEVDMLEKQVLDAQANLVEIRNSLLETQTERVVSQGLSERILDIITRTEEEMATNENEALSKDAHINKLKSDLKTLEQETKRLAASIPDNPIPTGSRRSFVGDGDRQYLTGLKVGGKRIFILVDTSASMLDETIVNIIRLRNMPHDQKIRAKKWQRTLACVDWLATQLPKDSFFQMYRFAEDTGPLVPDSEGQWLNAGETDLVNQAVAVLKKTAPLGGTNLERGLAAIARMEPRPDNVILLVDGLPTMGEKPSKDRTVTPRKRLKLFDAAIRKLPRGIPVNIILLPMEGDPMAASSYWKLALRSKGSLISPSEDWP